MLHNITLHNKMNNSLNKLLTIDYIQQQRMNTIHLRAGKVYIVTNLYGFDLLNEAHSFNNICTYHAIVM